MVLLINKDLDFSGDLSYFLDSSLWKREGRENRPQSRCGIEVQSSIEDCENLRAKPIGKPVKVEGRQTRSPKTYLQYYKKFIARMKGMYV